MSSNPEPTNIQLEKELHCDNFDPPYTQLTEESPFSFKDLSEKNKITDNVEKM